MTGNQKMAQKILGYVPEGYVSVCELMNNGTKHRIGVIYADGKTLAMFVIKPGDFNS